MTASELFPYVVAKGYFRIPGSGKKEPELERWGIVEPLGPDLFRMLVAFSDGMIKNVHPEEVKKLKLTVKAAQQRAVQNLRAMVEDGKEFQRQLSMSDDGLGHIVWMGHWLTASCVVLPELHEWAGGHLKTDEILVSVPQQQFMFLFSLGDASFRKDMRRYIKKVVEGMDKLITFDLFLLTKKGLEPYREPRKGR